MRNAAIIQVETIIIIGLLCAAAWFFLSGTYKTSVKDPRTLSETELEDVFIELKKRILVTSPYEQEKAYERLYYRITAVLGQIVDRHNHFWLDGEAKGMDRHKRATGVYVLFMSPGHDAGPYKAVPAPAQVVVWSLGCDL